MKVERAIESDTVERSRTSDDRCHSVSPVSVLGIPVQPVPLSAAVQDVVDAIMDERKLHIGVVNAAKVVNMNRDSELREAVLSSDVIYADGASVVWASRILGAPLPERVAGIDLMHAILEQGNKHNWKFYFLGATEQVLAETCSVLSRQYPGIRLVGSHHGYYEPKDEGHLVEHICDKKPDVIFVAISSPKKEQFMARWADRIGPIVTHGVGGSFDVVAGKVKRAPKIWQNLGLEWLYRVLQEPGRLWKRYLTTNSAFIYLVMRELVQVRLLKLPRGGASSQTE